MSKQTYYLIFAGIILILIPLVPKMVMIRVRFLRWLKWNKLADWHKRNIPVLTPIVRTLMACIAVVLVYAALF